jgi:hypothetical protein
VHAHRLFSFWRITGNVTTKEAQEIWQQLQALNVRQASAGSQGLVSSRAKEGRRIDPNNMVTINMLGGAAHPAYGHHQHAAEPLS